MKSLLGSLWRVFNAFPEGPWKMRMRLFLAFNRSVPSAVRRMSPVRASIDRYVPRPGDIVVDAGAFPGDYTIYAARQVGPTGRVIAFEPNPLNFEQLERHVAAFGVRNVTLVRKGLWSEDCVLKMEGQGVDSHLTKEGEHKVELVSLDNELARMAVPRVDVIKMDIEGAEIRALEGARETLTRNAVHLAIGSYHEFEGEVTRDRTEAILDSLGYEHVAGYPERPNTYAWKREAEARPALPSP